MLSNAIQPTDLVHRFLAGTSSAISAPSMSELFESNLRGMLSVYAPADTLVARIARESREPFRMTEDEVAQQMTDDLSRRLFALSIRMPPYEPTGPSAWGELQAHAVRGMQYRQHLADQRAVNSMIGFSTAGLAVATLPLTIPAAVAGTPLAMGGGILSTAVIADQGIAGTRQFITGRHTDTFVNQGIGMLPISQPARNVLSVGANFALPIAGEVAALNALARLEAQTLAASSRMISNQLARAGQVSIESRLLTNAFDASFSSAISPITDPSRLLPAPAAGRISTEGGKLVAFTQQQGQYYYRVFSGGNTEGAWLTATPPRSAAWAREALSLPPDNNADWIQRVFVPAGTRLQRSRALPVEQWGRLRGGGEQFHLLEHLPAENFGPGVPLR
jgi:hypothetical protein